MKNIRPQIPDASCWGYDLLNAGLQQEPADIHNLSICLELALSYAGSAVQIALIGATLLSTKRNGNGWLVWTGEIKIIKRVNEKINIDRGDRATKREVLHSWTIRWLHPKSVHEEIYESWLFLLNPILGLTAQVQQGVDWDRHWIACSYTTKLSWLNDFISITP